MSRIRLKLTLGLVVVALLFGCRLPAIWQFHYTSREPNKTDLTGTWIPNKSSLEAMATKGGYDRSVRPQLWLKSDGMFELSNMPDWWDDAFGKSHGGFRDYEGHWTVSTYGDTGHWDLELRPSSGTRFANLIGQSLPYRLEFVIGDADENESIIFEKFKP